MGEFRVVITGTVEDPAAFVDLGERMLANVRANDPGTTVYNWFVSEDGHCVNEDGYSSTEDWAAHFGSAQEQGFIDEFMGLVNISAVHVLGDVDAAAKEMLAPFGAVHYSQKASL